MSQEDFWELQSSHLSNGLSLKSYLKLTGTSYFTYNYWRKLCRRSYGSRLGADQHPP